ncbi:MAG: hypothetical protein Q8M40_08415 [Legionella sp.]|nr:hypothetical protein [Legionella sp.]
MFEKLVKKIEVNLGKISQLINNQRMEEAKNIIRIVENDHQKIITHINTCQHPLEKNLLSANNILSKNIYLMKLTYYFVLADMVLTNYRNMSTAIVIRIVLGKEFMLILKQLFNLYDSPGNNNIDKNISQQDFWFSCTYLTNEFLLINHELNNIELETNRVRKNILKAFNFAGTLQFFNHAPKDDNLYSKDSDLHPKDYNFCKSMGRTSSSNLM